MKTKLLYVLVSSPSDVYLEQAFVSASSARLRNPDAVIVLLADTSTLEGMEARGAMGKAFLQLFTEVVEAPLDPSLPPMKRSRLLKTGMRGYVKGDFLFIDADTIVARPLGDVDAIEASLAACRDLHSPFPVHPHYQATVNICRKLGFDASGETEYFNSGVMLVRDAPENHAFFQAWQENYLHGYAAGIRPDQPSLAQTGAAFSHPVALLDDVWNCEVQNGVRYLKDAYIVHYMVTNFSHRTLGSLYRMNDPAVLLRVRAAGGLTEEVREMVDDPLKGYAPVTQVFAGEDLFLFRTRRFRALRQRYVPGKWSLSETILKIIDHLPWKK